MDDEENREQGDGEGERASQRFGHAANGDTPRGAGCVMDGDEAQARKAKSQPVVGDEQPARPHPLRRHEIKDRVMTPIVARIINAVRMVGASSTDGSPAGFISRPPMEARLADVKDGLQRSSRETCVATTASRRIRC
jgi:hypothetical protein